MKILPIQNMPSTTRLEGETKRFSDDLKVSIDANNREIQKRLQDIAGGSTYPTLESGKFLTNNGSTVSWGTVNSIRKAYSKDAAGAATTITCYLDTDTTGTEITVNCSVIGTANLNAAAPRLEDGSLIFVALIGTDWWCVSPFIKTRVCP